MMIKKLNNILFCLFFVGCATSNLKHIKYTSNFQTSSKEKPFEKRTFIMDIPKGFSVEKEDFNPEYKEVVYKYDNKVKIYITDNTLAGSSLNGNNKLNEGISSISRKKLNDSIYMFGLQNDNTYWKENILNDIVVGYLNVPKERKEEFDKAIATITRK